MSLSLSNVPKAVKSSARFWDEKAKENPYWYVSSYGDYRATRNLEEFWASGKKIWNDLKAATNYHPGPDDIVVEIGCGVGRLTCAIGPEVGHVDAFDISNEMLEIARTANLHNVRFFQSKGFNLKPLDSDYADLVVGYCVFQHLPSISALESYISDMYRVVKPGGTVVFTLTPRDWRHYLQPALRLRSYLREKLFVKGGPKGIYKKAWVGIRPSKKQVCELTPSTLACVILHGDKWLFFGDRDNKTDLRKVP